ncbi:MAG: hypothetical protein AB8B80_01465 [Marinicellaceae bacterium]
MFLDLIKAIIIAGVPVALVSYFFTQLTRKKIPLNSENSKQLKKELKNTEFVNDDEENRLTQMLHKKWMHFGGGFYGVLVFMTYIHIEIYQIIEFITNFSSFQNFIDNIGLSMLINFFIEAILNLVTAFLWFIYWHDFLPIDSFWVWLIVVFVAHTVATKYALTKAQ